MKAGDTSSFYTSVVKTPHALNELCTNANKALAEIHTLYSSNQIIYTSTNNITKKTHKDMYTLTYTESSIGYTQ